ncbi:MAG: metalloregulator ArsR/SmtB family transcription factor [Candidatus Woesearchaeota archaeon]
MRCKSFDSFFINFANKTRLSIILLLREKPLSVTEITAGLKEEQSKISHNLRKLTQCNILSVEQKGKQRIYSLNKQTVLPMLDLVENHVKNHCCLGCKKK